MKLTMEMIKTEFIRRSQMESENAPAGMNQIDYAVNLIDELINGYDYNGYLIPNEIKTYLNQLQDDFDIWSNVENLIHECWETWESQNHQPINEVENIALTNIKRICDTVAKRRDATFYATDEILINEDENDDEAGTVYGRPAYYHIVYGPVDANLVTKIIQAMDAYIDQHHLKHRYQMLDEITHYQRGQKITKVIPFEHGGLTVNVKVGFEILNPEDGKAYLQQQIKQAENNQMDTNKLRQISVLDYLLSQIKHQQLDSLDIMDHGFSILDQTIQN